MIPPFGRAAKNIREFVQAPNVFGKVAVLMVVGAAVGWSSVPVFDTRFHVVGDYRGTAAVALAACGASVVAFFTACRNAMLVWRDKEPLNLTIPAQFNSWLVLLATTGIGVTVALSVFR